MLGSPSVCQNHPSLCSADFPRVLCQCVAVSCVVMYHSASSHAYKMSNFLTQMKTSLVFFTTAAEREPMGIATGSWQTGENVDVVGLSPSFSLEEGVKI